jgi:hypothetical protein
MWTWFSDPFSSIFPIQEANIEHRSSVGFCRHDQKLATNANAAQMDDSAYCWVSIIHNYVSQAARFCNCAQRAINHFAMVGECSGPLDFGHCAAIRCFGVFDA